MSEKLLPCPFCGEEAEIKSFPVFTNLRPYSPETADKKYYVQRKGCATQCGALEYDTPEEAMAAWNRRAAGWIPTVERLPEENVDCLVYPASEEIVIARLVKGNFYYWWFDAFDSPDWVKVEGVVTHWMPLPKPPELCEGGGIDVTIR